MRELIEKQVAIDAVEESRRLNHHQDGKEACAHEYEHRHFLKILRDLPSAQPEITDEQAIEHLQESGWMQNHDRQMYEAGLRERLADDSGSYDALLPSARSGIEEKLYQYKCFITDNEGLQHEVIHIGDIRRVTGWEI